MIVSKSASLMNVQKASSWQVEAADDERLSEVDIGLVIGLVSAYARILQFQPIIFAY